MPRSKTHAVQAPKNVKNLISVDMREIERKIRRPGVPVTRVHRSKKAYSRKLKHPKRDVAGG